jgi:hypothetical protein
MAATRHFQLQRQIFIGNHQSSICFFRPAVRTAGAVDIKSRRSLSELLEAKI